MVLSDGTVWRPTWGKEYEGSCEGCRQKRPNQNSASPERRRRGSLLRSRPLATKMLILAVLLTALFPGTRAGFGGTYDINQVLQAAYDSCLVSILRISCPISIPTPSPSSSLFVLQDGTVWRPTWGKEYEGSCEGCRQKRPNQNSASPERRRRGSLLRSRPLATKMLILAVLLTALFPGTRAGFGGTYDINQVLQAAYGNPCDCSTTAEKPPEAYVQSQDCSDKTAYLTNGKTSTGIGAKPHYVCTRKAIVAIVPPGSPLPKCNCSDYNTPSVHSSCYKSVAQCQHKNQTYFTAVLLSKRAKTFGGDYTIPSPYGVSYKLAQASCPSNKVGQTICWSSSPQVGVSDGGGPHDQMKAHHVRKTLQALFPSLSYHPLALPRPRSQDLSSNTRSILEAMHKALNDSGYLNNSDCWLCMTFGPPLPIAIPSNSISGATNGTYSLPFPVQLHHINCINVTCVSKPPRNNSFDLDVGSVWLACNCSNHTNVSQEIFSPPGQVFVCGNNLAYTYLPNNWTGSCLPAFLLPEASVLPGDTAVPIPSFDFLAGRRKRALQFLPFLAALGVTAGVGTGTAGLSYSLRSYQALSEQLINDVGVLSGTINIIQNQIHSPAEVVLRNRRGLDLLTAEKGGICLALGEKCCFYVNQSGIVSDKIKALQADLARRRKALADNPLWGGWNGLLPYVLPLLGPLLGLLLLLSIGPVIFNKVMAFIRTQIEAIKMQPLQVPYHKLEMAERELEMGLRNNGTISTAYRL
ncbi:syncytin-1-like [Aotus nancymaae]|uniref:syncytin-1-like n=1 Tax=Aotus nancymaae TaxID=37293 RepID=UPI0030FE7249